MIDYAYAMTAAPQGSGGQAGGGFGGFLPLIMIFAIFYFLLIRPQQKKAKEHQKSINALKKGDNVTILAESGPIRITDMGQAKQDGAVGNKITVLNLTSKKIIMAEVMNPNLVKVIF